jgi:hypothetical protein
MLGSVQRSQHDIAYPIWVRLFWNELSHLTVGCVPALPFDHAIFSNAATASQSMKSNRSRVALEASAERAETKWRSNSMAALQRDLNLRRRCCRLPCSLVKLVGCFPERSKIVWAGENTHLRKLRMHQRQMFVRSQKVLSLIRLHADGVPCRLGLRIRRQQRDLGAGHPKG